MAAPLHKPEEPSNLNKSQVINNDETEASGSLAPGTASTTADHLSQGVRFSSRNQEIDPPSNLAAISNLSTQTSGEPADISPEAQQELQNLSETLKHTRLQQRRMSNFAFEPVSLPASRVPSNDSSSRPTSRHPSLAASPQISPGVAHVDGNSKAPMLTPAASRSNEDPRQNGETARDFKQALEPATLTPQTSDPRGSGSALAAHGQMKDVPSTSSSQPSSRPSSRPPSSDRISTNPTTASEGSTVHPPPPHHGARFSVGPGGETSSRSRDSSPSSRQASGSGQTTPQSRTVPPPGEADDPYARNKRLPQSRNLDGIEHRFVFSSRDSRRSVAGQMASAGTIGNLPRSGGSATDLKSKGDEKRHSHILGFGKKDHLTEDGSGKHESMSNLKRFFRVGANKNKRSHSPASSMKSASKSDKSGTRTPPHQLPPSTVPFADDHGLESKYGKFGKILGSGAGGSVRLLKRSSDGTMFAVKQFRARHNYESEKEYAKKVTAEFCIGSTLHHGNVIETLDIVHEKSAWYEVMEFAPFDLFAIVMTGKMSREEVACSFLQIVQGVAYLHSMGLAHRDLKLDNVVVNDRGIMKLIDFGSASVFRYPFENDIVLCTGIVGSDPYLAPEVYDLRKYDPQPTDIWSLAIIFACMSLRRFPWKLPRTTDASYKKFISAPNSTTDPTYVRHLSEPHAKSSPALSAPENNKEKADGSSSEPSDPQNNTHHHHHHHGSPDGDSPEDQKNSEARSHSHSEASSSTSALNRTSQKPEEILGPWRLLRLLPRESRHIIGRMLEIDPKNRATLQEMVLDPWIDSTPVCKQEEGGKVISAQGHVHTLEPGTTVAAES